MTLVWNDSYKLGNATIDAEHEYAFKLANQFLEAQTQAEMTVVAMQLYKHTREHFKHEEAMMRDSGFPDVKAHTERHNTLISRLNAISTSIANGSLERQPLVSLMNDWAMHHIVQDDAKFAAYITK